MKIFRIVARYLSYKPRNLGIKILHGCREIAFCPMGYRYFNLSHPVCRLHSHVKFLSSAECNLTSFNANCERVNVKSINPNLNPNPRMKRICYPAYVEFCWRGQLPTMDRGKTPPAINVVKWQAPAGLREVVMACGLKELRISE